MHLKENRVFGLDLLRATAILMVVMAHYFASTSLRFCGVLGVELFFVLSGFLIGGILVRAFQKNGTTFRVLKEFWIRRWFRTIPNYIFFLGILTLCSLGENSIDYKKWILYPVFLQNFAWPIGSFFEVSWSLAVEEWFYLLFPGILWLVIRKRGLSLKSLLLVTLLFFIIPPLARWGASEFFRMDDLRKVTVLRLDAMMYGVLMAALRIYGFTWWRRMERKAFLFIGVAVLISGCVFYHVDGMSAEIMALPIISLGVAVMIPTLETIGGGGLIFGSGVTYISRVSYSAYLLHMPVFFLVENFISGYPSNYIKLIERVALLVIVFLLSFIPYRLVEIPFLSLRNKFAPQEGVKVVQSSLGA